MWTCFLTMDFILKKKKSANMADILQRSGNEKFRPAITIHSKGTTVKS